MHATHVLNNHIYKMCQDIHQGRWNALMSTVTALLQGKKLSVTGLGRAMPGESYEKHKIKKADRLIGNLYLNQERKPIYRALAHLLIGRCRRPVIHVDWSDLTPDREFHWIRGTIPVGGRALPIYEESHRQKDYAKPKVEKRFFDKLESDSSCPLLSHYCH